METSCISNKKYKIQPKAGKLILSLSGIHKNKSGTLSREGHNSNKQCLLEQDAVGLCEASCSSKMLRNGDRVLYCCMQYPSTVDIHQHLKYEVLEIPSYSPDLAASDYHMFGPLRDVFKRTPL